MKELSKSVDTREVKAPVTASSTINSNSDILDMAGYDGVRFIVPITDADAGGIATLTAEGNSANSDTGMTALTGASATVTCVSNDDINGTLLIVDVLHPLLRYIQGVLTSSAANIAYGNMIAELYHSKKQPITDAATVSDATSVVGV
jgi:hypothetical protein